MYKRLLAMLLSALVFFASGLMCVFATSNGEDVVDEPSLTEETDVVDEIATEGSGEIEDDEAEVVKERTMTRSALKAPVQIELDSLEVRTSAVKWNGVTVSWDQIDEADEYVVSVGDEVFKGTTTSATFTGLKENTPYEASVIAYTLNSEDGVVVGSGSTSFQTPYLLPNSVINARALSGFNSVTIKWDGTSNADGYYIYWHQTGKENAYKGSTTVGKSVRALKVAATEGINYTFRIYAIRTVDGKTIRSGSYKTVTGSAIGLMKIRITFKTSRTLTSHSGGAVKATFKQGTSLNATGFTNGKYTFNWKGSDGKVRLYYVTRISIKNPKIVKVENKKTYTWEEAEAAVNALKIGSSTNKLIWVNQYTQKLYVFTGRAGNWKRTAGPWLVSSGKASEPTSTGRTSIKNKVKSRHGLPCWSMCNWFSLHGKNSAWTLGYPRSGACIRNTNDHAKWIYNNCKKGTTVYIY